MKRDLIIEYVLFGKRSSPLMTAKRVGAAVGCTRRYAHIVLEDLATQGTVDCVAIEYGNHYKKYYCLPEYKQLLTKTLKSVGNVILEIGS